MIAFKHHRDVVCNQQQIQLTFHIARMVQPWLNAISQSWSTSALKLNSGYCAADIWIKFDLSLKGQLGVRLHFVIYPECGDVDCVSAGWLRLALPQR